MEEDRFRPLRPASRARLAAGFVLGPITWIVAFVVTSWVIEYTDAIAYALVHGPREQRVVWDIPREIV